MTRRTFLSRCGLGVSAAALASQAVTAESSYPDRFTYRGYDVRWTGWREPMNQALVFGAWFAWPSTQRESWPVGHVATTMAGYVGTVHELDVFDTHYDRQWPSPSFDVPNMPSAERDALKQRACRALLEHL